MSIGSIYLRLKEIREESGLSQTETARLSGFLQKDISKYEGGKAKFIPEGYLAFWFSRGYDLNWIHTGKGPKEIDLAKFEFDKESFHDLQKKINKQFFKSLATTNNFSIIYFVILETIYRKMKSKKNPKQKLASAIHKEFKTLEIIKELITLGILNDDEIPDLIKRFLAARLS